MTHVAVRRVYLKLLAVVYALAFASLLVQMGGLIGRGGILPMRAWLAAVQAQTGAERYLLVPTLCWLWDGDGMLYLLGGLGITAAAVAFFEYAVVPALALAWVAYLSLVSVGQDFLSFQWDTLLLETGFVSIFLAPPGLGRAARAQPTPVISLWLMRWLVFRLMFSSGVVKLLSGDASWWGLTALAVHYETQPIPNAPAWYVHQLPAWSHKVATLQMFAVELAAPFLIFFYRHPRLRLAGASLLAALQLAIAATGNYGFFNLLSAALCVLVVDDAHLPARWRSTVVEPTSAQPTAVRPSWSWPRPLLIAVAGLLGTLSLVQLGATLRLVRRLPPPLAAVYSWTSPLRIVNGYGLFAVMTTTRPEIVVEGSEDGERWLPYDFRYKPGDMRRAPPQVAPHMPRLDWQMWFAALDRWDETSWFAAFEAALLQARPAVLALLAHDPFAGRRPRFIRARLYRYRFSRGGEAKDGAWWVREELGPYGPTLSAEQVVADVRN